MVLRVKKIRAGKLGILCSILMLVLSIPVGMLGTLKNALQEGFMAPAGRFLFFGSGQEWVLLFPLIAGITGFLSGCLVAFIYNVITRWLGGVELEVDDIIHPS